MAAMPATAAGRLFSLELLVDWVRLETGLSPCTARPAVAFRLLDFPPLLVLPPAAPGPELQRGAIGFGRGKACLLRLRPAALRRPRLRVALLQLPAGPTPAPRLLGTCDILLAPSLGQRGVFTLRGPEAEHVGELALFYRLTDLGRFPPGPPQLQGPLSPACITGSEALEVSEPRTEETSKPCTKDTSTRCLQCVSNSRFLEALDPCTKDTNSWSAGDSDPSTVQKSWEEAVLHSKASSGDVASAPCSPAPSGRSDSPVSLEATELDFETNTFCPPPLYYTHMTQEKTPSARVDITIEPQRNEPEDLDDIFPETKLVGPAVMPVEHTRSAIQESPPVLLNLPQAQGPGEANEAPCPPQIEQSTVNAIRQLPLLNALLIELSLLCNQPVANPTQVHPQLAWLYRGEHKGPDPSTKSTSRSESKTNKLSVRENEKLVNPQSKKNPKGKHSKISGSPPPKVTKGRLLYGLTNTLRLRLQQTNPDMLVVHERREQYRKSQIQAVGPKLRILSCKGKVSSLAAESQMPPQLPRNTSTDSNGKVSTSLAVQSQMPPQLSGDESLDSNGSFAEGSDTSMQISAGFDESSATKEVKQSHAMKKTVDQSENRTVVTSLRAPSSPAGSVIPERSSRSQSFRGKWKKKVQSPGLSRQDPTVDKTVDEGKDGRKVKATSVVDTSENRPPSRKSSFESISELQYQDGFTSPCYSEDFCTTENNSRSLPAPDSSTGAERAQKGSRASRASEARLSTRKNSSEASSMLTPPFSAGSPVCSHKRSRVLKTHDSLEEASSLSTSDFSSQWTNEKENQADPGSSKVMRRGQDSSTKVRAGHKSSEKSQSPRTSQVSSYEPSNLSELELKAIDDSASADFQEEEDGLGSLRISKQCRDICELVINKLPGYTV